MTWRLTDMSLRPVLFILIFAISACSSNNNYQVATALDATFEPTIKLQRDWVYYVQDNAMPSRLPLQPVVVNDMVFAVNEAGQIHGLRLDTGRPVLSWELGESVSSGLASNGSDLFVGTLNGELISMDLAGNENWKAKLTSRAISLPATSANSLFVQTQDGYLAALDLKTGQQLWIYDSGIPRLTMFGDAQPVVVGSQVIASFASGKIYGFEAATGQVLWSQNLGKLTGRTDLERINDADATPVPVNKNLVFGNSLNEEILLISLETGLPVKRYNVGSRHSVIPFEDYLVIIKNDDTVIGLSPQTGEILWENNDFQYRNLTDGVSWQEYIVVADSFGWLHLLDPVTGTPVARYQTDYLGVAGKPVIADSQLLVQGEAGRLKSFSIH